MNTVLYFGCWSGCGHFLHTPGGSTLRDLHEDFPFALHILDTGFLPPKKPETQGLASLVHINGWTVLAFWDRSVDSRPKSNSAFVIRGEHAFQESCELAKKEFPNIWARFTFPIVPRTP